VYYEPNSGDKDARDLLDMQKMEMLKEGVDPRLLDDEKLNSKIRMNPFHTKESNSNKKLRPNEESKHSMGSFEKYTKGVGRKLLEKSGWKEGEPIGNPSRSGLVEALDSSSGKPSTDKTGIGYHGEKVDRERMIDMQKQRQERERRNTPYYIATKYDRDSTTYDTLLTRNEYSMKYRSTEWSSSKKSDI
jgi:hypothetical protein